MNVPEHYSLEALKVTMPFEAAEKLATQCAQQAIQELELYNQKYMSDDKTKWFDDGSSVKFVPMDNKEIEPVVRMLSRSYLMLLHRRGLVGL
jgi:hypothetical protein